MNELLIRALGGAIWVLANRHNEDRDQWEQYAAAAEADLRAFIAAGRFEVDQSDQVDTISDLLAAMPSMPHPGGKLIEVVARYEDGSKQTINGHVMSSAIAKARGDQVDGVPPECFPLDEMRVGDRLYYRGKPETIRHTEAEFVPAKDDGPGPMSGNESCET